MKCGVGVCGHCHMDNKLVCVDGPVFSRAELQNLDIEELRLNDMENRLPTTKVHHHLRTQRPQNQRS